MAPCTWLLLKERGGCLPVPGPAGSQAADLPGQAAHRQGDRAGKDEEDGGSAAGTKPQRGTEGESRGGWAFRGPVVVGLSPGVQLGDGDE